jgi:hypothetical protein
LELKDATQGTDIEALVEALSNAGKASVKQALITAGERRLQELREEKGHAPHGRHGGGHSGADAGDASGSEDDADAPVKWERFRADKNRWVPYEKNNNDQIEAAYQRYLADPSRHNREIEITIKGKYKCTLNFKYMNATSHGRNKGRTEIRFVRREGGDADADQDSGSEDDHFSPVTWEYYLDTKKRWERYDQYNNDQIEDAYQILQADDLAYDEIVITVNIRYKYTINLNRMTSTSHGPKKNRIDVRRLVDGVVDPAPADDAEAKAKAEAEHGGHGGHGGRGGRGGHGGHGGHGADAAAAAKPLEREQTLELGDAPARPLEREQTLELGDAPARPLEREQTLELQ